MSEEQALSPPEGVDAPAPPAAPVRMRFGKPVPELPPPSKREWPPKAHRYIRYIETGGEIHTKKAAKAVHVRPAAVSVWRRELVGFLDRENEIRAARKRLKKSEIPVTATGMMRVNVNGLTLLQCDYIRELVAHKGNRIQACETAAIPWREVRGWLEESPRFKEEYLAVLEEKTIANVDAIGDKGAKGDTSAARMFLGMTDPSSPPKVGGSGNGGGPDRDGKPLGVDRDGAQQMTTDWLSKYALDLEQGHYGTPPAEPEPEAEAESEELAAAGARQ